MFHCNHLHRLKVETWYFRWLHFLLTIEQTRISQEGSKTYRVTLAHFFWQALVFICETVKSIGFSLRSFYFRGQGPDREPQQQGGARPPALPGPPDLRGRPRGRRRRSGSRSRSRSPGGRGQRGRSLLVPRWEGLGLGGTDGARAGGAGKGKNYLN